MDIGNRFIFVRCPKIYEEKIFHFLPRRVAQGLQVAEVFFGNSAIRRSAPAAADGGGEPHHTADWPARPGDASRAVEFAISESQGCSFDEVGLPGFQFIQDPIEYKTRTHHTNMDTYERIQEADLKQMAVIVATFAYQAANADQLLPRKPMPKH